MLCVLYFQRKGVALGVSLEARVTLREESSRELTMKLGDVKVAVDPRLVNPVFETKRLEARKAIRMARQQLTAEIKGWDKMLAKYESRAGKGEPLTQAGRTLIVSSSVLSQESASTYLTLILSSIDTL